MWDLSKLFHLASLCIITGIDSAVDLIFGVCVLTLPTMGVDAVEVGVKGVSWVNTLTLYLPLPIIVFLLLPLTVGAGDFLTLGLVLGWAGHSWFCCIWTCCDWVGCDWVWGWDFGLGTKSPFQFQLCSHFPDKGGVRIESCTPWITFNYLRMSCPFFTMCESPALF